MNLFENSRQVTVLGAGMVGVSCALALQSKGWRVTLIDRRAPGEETSSGNAGVLSRSSLLPFNQPGFLQSLPSLLLNSGPSLQVRASALAQWQWMWRFLWHSKHSSFEVTTRALDALIQLSSATHKAWTAQASSNMYLQHRWRDTGWLWLYPHETAFAGSAFSREILKEFSVATEVLNANELQMLEPHLAPIFSHAIWIKDAASVDNPGAVVKAYAQEFVRAGGEIRIDEAKAISQQPVGWQWRNQDGKVHWAPNLVVAMGPWSETLLKDSQLPSTLKVHMGFERGYHRHFKPAPGVGLDRPIYDMASAYVLSPMQNDQGESMFRLTTGIELADRDSKPNLNQLENAENAVRRVLALKETMENSNWLGSRPTTPDSRPVIGEMPNCPGLWLAFGHQHIGFSTGPGTGVLLSELMSGEATSIDPHPFKPERF